MVLVSDTKSSIWRQLFITIQTYKWERCEIDEDRYYASRRQDFQPQKHVPITLVGIPYLSLIYLGLNFFETTPSIQNKCNYYFLI